MAYYFVANIRINDSAGYKDYLEHVDKVFSEYNGQYLAVDTDPAVIEGKWNYTKSVLIKFKSKQDFKKWYYSEEYQKILRFSLDAAECDSILIEGLEK